MDDKTAVAHCVCNSDGTKTDGSEEELVNITGNSKNVKVKGSHHSPGVAQILGRIIALLFHDCGTRRG